jgi:hypothetical protein
MLIGPHCNPSTSPRMDALQAKWTVFQSNYCTTQSLATPKSLPREDIDYPIWFWHASYMASTNPNWAIRTGVGAYLREMLDDAIAMNIKGCVIHAGAMVDRPINHILDGTERFLAEFGLNRDLIAIELPAWRTTLGRDPTPFVERFPWCLDLAHTFAAGCPWDLLHRVVESYPPRVCHINFPGSPFGSGKDVHGWRCNPALHMVSKTMMLRPAHVITDIVTQYDSLIRLLIAKQIPMIVEGSSFPIADKVSEVNFIRSLFE